MSVNEKTTIAAISTAMSNSGIGIVRMSGGQAFEIADLIYKGKRKLKDQKTHTIHYGYIMDGNETVDEVLVMLMRGPRSYTGEDIVEINCHGGIYVVRRILELLIRSGARPAEPGEFTKRAFLNGRMDLSQAEAVGDLIASRNEYALQSSLSQLKGSVRKKIAGIRNRIIYHTAFIESALDDPEHVSVDGYGKELGAAVAEMTEELEEMIASFDSGRILKEGINTVIVGKPNVGKSSLLNALIGEDRAIVTDVAGTTRDVLEEQINLQGISLNVMDTAGIRDTSDIVESIGVGLAKEHARKADLIIHVIDASVPLDEDDAEIFQVTQGKRKIILLNKSDLNMITHEEDINNFYFASIHSNLYSKKKDEIPYIIEISAKNGEGIHEFETVVKELFFAGNLSFNNEIYITNIRQKSALQEASASLIKVAESIRDGLPEDFYSIDLMAAYEALGSITGETTGEDLVNEIFSKFCMGK